MARCRFRPAAYRIGLGFIALGFVLIGLGYGFPTWVRTSKRRTLGLWLECGNQWSSCVFVQPTHVLEWTMRALLGASLLMYLVTFAMAIRENCCGAVFYTCCLAGRKTEVLAFLAELLGIAGVLMYSVQEYQDVGNFSRLAWAHALCDFGLAVSLIGSIMMACAQQSLPAAKAAAGRIVAKPGYESLANNNHRSASLQSRSTHGTQASSPFPGRSTTPHISGPYPSPAAIAAVNAAVSPKQQRASLNGPQQLQQQRKLSSPTPYPALDSPGCSSPCRRRKSSAQERQFAGVHNQNKHPPVFSTSERVQEEWRAQQEQEQQQLQQLQQCHTWSESMRMEEEAGVKQQRALKSQMEMEQALQHHAHTWSAAHERERAAWAQGAQSQLHNHDHNHYDRDWRATGQVEQYAHHPKMPPPPAPPSAVAPAHYGAPVREGYRDYPPADARLVQAAGYQYPPGQGYGEGQWPQPPPASSTQQYLSPAHPHPPRPDSGNFPDPPPPEQLLCYEEERSTETISYQGFPNPIPGDMPPPPCPMQPVVLYRAPSHPGQSPVTETVAIRSQESYHHVTTTARPAKPPVALPASVPHYAHQHPQYQQYHQQLKQQQQSHQTFPRQQAAHPPANAGVYSTYRR